MKKLIIGNWKMSLSNEAVQTLAENFAGADLGNIENAQLAVCPSSVHLQTVINTLRASQIGVGAQDCSDQDNGAYTGQNAASMLSEIGCNYVIVGHSERRQYNGETNALIKAKAQKAIENNLTPIICVGETQQERDSGNAQSVVESQVQECMPESQGNIIVAYEPVWAIGTGNTASAEDAQTMHALIRKHVGNKVPILYGGSMKPANAQELLSMPDIDGGLIGGASLNAEDFISIAKVA